jgi:tetratricopeptide (TPR) repeat protein
MHGKTPLLLFSILLTLLVVQVGKATPDQRAAAPQSRSGPSGHPAPASGASLNGRSSPGPGKESRAASASSPPTTEEALRTEVALLKEKVDTLTSAIEVGLAVVGTLLTGLLVGLALLAWRGERRLDEAHGMAVAGERGSQARAQETHQAFLQASRDTLDLVNATLGLAKEASERATRAIEQRASVTLKGLDLRARALIDSATVPSKDDRALVADPDHRSALRSLAQRISAFESNRLMLPPSIELTPECMFIRGLDFHLNQQFQDAFDSWASVAEGANTPSTLKSLAWYWIGYERNNLGEFAAARDSFEKALEFAAGPRHYELQRLCIESRFFNRAKEPASALLRPLRELLTEVGKAPPGEEIEIRKARILTTLGNVCLQAGRDLERQGGSQGQDIYAEAVTHFDEAKGRDKWAWVGLAQCLHASRELARAEEIFAERVRAIAINEYITREEPRTKVLARQTELICCICVPAFKTEIRGIHSQVVEALGRVDARMTVYSQVQKRNVTKNDFREDLDELMRQAPN